MVHIVLWNSVIVSTQGYRDRYDIIDHGHEKTTFMFFFHRFIKEQGISGPRFWGAFNNYVDRIFPFFDPPANRIQIFAKKFM